MPRNVALVTLAVLAALLTTDSGASWADSPWYAFCDRARVLEVEGPNLLKVRLLGRDQVMSMRLIGVGSPRNRDRVRQVSQETLSFIEKNRVWEASRDYVQGALQGRTVEIWTRRGDRYDEKNRLLGYVLIPLQSGDSVDLNGEIIRLGLAFVTRDHLHVTYVRYKQFEDEAKTKRRGMWGGATLGRMSNLVP